jgi:AraC-like DNA-binding protein
MIYGCEIKNHLSIVSLYSLFNREYTNGYFFRGESHDFYEVVCVIKGEVGITAGKNIYSLKSGEMILHPPGEFHAIRNEKEEDAEVIIFSFSATSFPVIDEFICFIGERGIQEIKALYAALSTQLIIKNCLVYNTVTEHNAELSVEIKRLEIFLMTYLIGNTKINRSENTQSTEIFSKILSTMENNLDKALTAGKIASICGISIPTLEKTVYKYLGYGAMAHYNILKMQKAQTLLLCGSSAKETALLLGFSNQNYFSARFKKYYGYPPSKIKVSKRNNEKESK